MHGFAINISINEAIKPVKFKWKTLFNFQSKHCLRRYEASHINIEQFTSDKFLAEKLWIENDQFFIVTDGVISNLSDLRTKYNVTDNEQLITKIAKNPEFFNAFSGHFAGFIWNKKTNEYQVFNNHCGSKKIFYYFDIERLIFTTDLFTLSRLLDSYKINKTLDIDAAYLLLTSGFMHEDYTLINEVRQLRAGEYAQFSDRKLEIKSYFHLQNIVENSDSKAEAIAHLNNLFDKAVNLEYELDESHNFKSVSTLSGGLDSRMTALVAYKNGYRNQKFLNFSEKDYADEIIAKQIAKQYKIDLIQIPLSAQGLCSIDEVVSINDGLTLYSGAGHVFEAIQNMVSDNKIDLNSIGIIHTGLIGDAVLGSFLSSSAENKAQITNGLYSKGLLSKAKRILEQNIENYPNEEIYKFYNRAFLGANNGFLFLDLIGECSSPFLHPDFIAYGYSIARKFKYKEKIYINWIKSSHPEFANFTWESIGGKPTNNEFLRQYYRYKRAIVKRLPIKSMWRNNMSPEQYWYDNNPQVKTYLDNYYKNHIHLSDTQPELKNDLILLYESGNITEKTQVLTLLGAIKLLF